MEKPKITAYLKTTCGWSNGVRAILAKYNLPYEEKDILKNPEFRAEMEQLSGQKLSPCLVINDHMLPDISGEEFENWLVSNDLIARSDAPVDVPINSSCQNKSQHVA
jgi:glutaredoxin